MVNTLGKTDAAGWVAVCGQFWPVVDEVRRSAPDTDVRYSIETPRQWERFVKRVREDDSARKVCIQHRFLSEGKARFLDAHGVEAYCWTIDTGGAATRVIEMGAAGIISNNLRMLEALG